MIRCITNEIPFNSSWNRPSKKSIASGVYLPYDVKEKCQLALAIDTSGSIGRDELKQFLGEIVNIVRSYNTVEMTVMTCDVKVQDVFKLDNGNIQKFLNMKLHGGGGTSFDDPIKYFNKNLHNYKMLIYFTDGEGSVKEKCRSKLLWILCKGGTDRYIKGKGEIVQIR